MSTTGAKVLIVDDDEAVTQTFAGILRLEGHEVRTALDAESGLLEAETLHPDAIIVDLRMPLINGVGFLYRLRSREGCKNTPVAIVTADYMLDESIPRELVELGAELHYKPLWLEDVVELTRSLLASAQKAEPSRPANQ
jgi:two-component system, OmpR family, response regulator MprA